MESGKLLYLQGDGPTICTDWDRQYGSLPGPIDSELTVAHDPAGECSARPRVTRDTSEWSQAMTIRLPTPAY